MTVDERRAANLERVRRYRTRHPDRRQQADAGYRERHGSRLRQRDNAKRQENLEAARATDRHSARGRRHVVNPAHARARMDVRNALRRGDLVKPNECPACGEPTPSHRMHAHHADYSRPLDVEWKCSVCHGQAHRKEAP